MGLAGVSFQPTGPVPGTGSVFDIQYKSNASPPTWDAAAGVFVIWPDTSPGPADCQAGYPGTDTAKGTQARLGDTYCFIDFHSTVFVYLQVAAISSKSVRLNGWLWTR